MRQVYRVVDANLNRAREGLRVLEEIARFVLDDVDLTANLKDIRHNLNTLVSEASNLRYDIIHSRDSEGDVGAGSWTKRESARDSLFALATANFKRVQEAARVLEEFGKLLGLPAREFKKIRFETYLLEKKIGARLCEQINTTPVSKGEL